jgi:hypothetical protein
LTALPQCAEAWKKGDAKEFEKAFSSINEKSRTGQRWCRDHLLISSMTTSGYEAMQKVVKPMTLEGIADKIKMPTFVGCAKNDIFFKGQPEKVAAAIGSNATLFEFGDELSAGAHCASGALTYQNQVVFEWLAKIVGR